MKNSLIFTACALSMSLSLLSSCTDVELCSDAEHPHTTPVVFDYDWSEAHEQSDSMYVIAYRVIKCKYYSMAVNSTDHLGRFIYGAPAEPTTPQAPLILQAPQIPQAKAVHRLLSLLNQRFLQYLHQQSEHQNRQLRDAEYSL